MQERPTGTPGELTEHTSRLVVEIRLSEKIGEHSNTFDLRTWEGPARPRKFDQSGRLEYPDKGMDYKEIADQIKGDGYFDLLISGVLSSVAESLAVSRVGIDEEVDYTYLPDILYRISEYYGYAPVMTNVSWTQHALIMMGKANEHFKRGD